MARPVAEHGQRKPSLHSRHQRARHLRVFRSRHRQLPGGHRNAHRHHHAFPGSWRRNEHTVVRDRWRHAALPAAWANRDGRRSMVLQQPHTSFGHGAAEHRSVGELRVPPCSQWRMPEGFGGGGGHDISPAGRRLRCAYIHLQQRDALPPIQFPDLLPGCERRMVQSNRRLPHGDILTGHRCERCVQVPRSRQQWLRSGFGVRHRATVHGR